MGKQKYELEFLLNTSPKILYNCISTPSGLSEWFSDDVNIKNGVYIFIWGDSEEEAKLLTKKNNEYIKFQWLELEEEKKFFELRIKIDPMTKQVALIVTDFADRDEIDEAKLLWESQINTLKHVLGA